MHTIHTCSARAPPSYVEYPTYHTNIKSKQIYIRVYHVGHLLSVNTEILNFAKRDGLILWGRFVRRLVALQNNPNKGARNSVKSLWTAMNRCLRAHKFIGNLSVCSWVCGWEEPHSLMQHFTCLVKFETNHSSIWKITWVLQNLVHFIWVHCLYISYAHTRGSTLDYNTGCLRCYRVHPKATIVLLHHLHSIIQRTHNMYQESSTHMVQLFRLRPAEQASCIMEDWMIKYYWILWLEPVEM